MNNIERKLDNIDYGQKISKIIEGKLIEIYGVNGYRSILKTIIENSKRSEKEIVTNFDLFSRLIQKIFGQMGVTKMLEPIEDDIIIVSSSGDPFVAEISAKNSALWTIATN